MKALTSVSDHELRERLSAAVCVSGAEAFAPTCSLTDSASITALGLLPP
ncbi:MAG: hypothetical protein IPM35_23300 [Myxococcales bacterium]|nr:hypothetical protein [Myxococcales bacterium]